jgi:hypothetical protein
MPLSATALANQIEIDFRALWLQRKGAPIGAASATERELLFLAIARGLLNYLEAQQNEMFSTINLQLQGSSTTYTYTVHALDLNKAP